MKLGSASAITVAITLLGLAACGDGTGPSEIFEIDGEWLWSVSYVASDRMICDVNNVIVSFDRDGSALAGAVISNGGGNFTCKLHGGTFLSDLVIDEPLIDGLRNENELSFTFLLPPGPWTSTGSIKSRTSMSGTARIHVAEQHGSRVVIGRWAATRAP